MRLHGEISLSLLCLQSSWGSALVLASPLRVGHPQVSFSCPDSRLLKQRLIRALLLTQARERERYGSHNWNVGPPGVAEASMTLQLPDVLHVFSWGSCPWIMGSWQWRVAKAPREVC